MRDRGGRTALLAQQIGRRVAEGKRVLVVGPDSTEDGASWLARRGYADFPEPRIARGDG